MRDNQRLLRVVHSLTLCLLFLGMLFLASSMLAQTSND